MTLDRTLQSDRVQSDQLIEELRVEVSINIRVIYLVSTQPEQAPDTKFHVPNKGDRPPTLTVEPPT